MSAVLTQAALTALFLQCAPNVAPETLHTLIGVESSANQFAVAVVGKTVSQPTDLDQALALVKNLEKNGDNYSLGIMQVNKSNFKQYKLTPKDAFDSCKNIEVGAKIYESCYERAVANGAANDQVALRDAMSCYYSNNFIRGYQKEGDGKSYVDRINNQVDKLYKVPSIKPLQNSEDSESSQSVQNAPKETHPAWDVYGDFK